MVVDIKKIIIKSIVILVSFIVCCQLCPKKLNNYNVVRWEIYMNIALKLFILPFLFSQLFLTGCKDNSINPSRETSFYPIKVGNSWEYNFKDYDSTGTLVHESLIDETFIYARMKDGQPVFQFNSPLNPPSPACCDYRYYFENKFDGVHHLVSSDSTGYWFYDDLWYKYPCNKNDYFTNGTNNYDTTFVIALNDTVVCDAGRFECILYKNVFRDFEDSTFATILGYAYIYVSKGVGKIKFESYWSKSSGEFYKNYEYSLNSYVLK